MIDGLKPYPAYRESGVAWLGEVPAHWSVRRNKLLFREINDRSSDGSEDLLTVSQYTGVSRRREHIEDGAMVTNAESLIGYKRVRPGDLVINIMLAWNGSLGVSAIAGIVSPAYSVFRAGTAVEPRYVHYLFRTSIFTGAFRTVSTGVVDSRLRLYPDVFFRLPSLIPPRSEQAAIVRFLDHADRRIRRYIRAKQKLIKLLEEQKQAIVNRAVTRGLDARTRRRSSGIAGADGIPEHWSVLPLLRCAVERADYRGSTPAKMDSGVFLVTAKNVRRGYIDYSASCEYVAEKDYARIMRRGLPRIDDLLFTTEAPLGNVALVDREDIALAQRVIRFRFDQRMLLPRFALNAMQAAYFQVQLSERATGSTAQGIKASKLPQLQLILPPVPEQRQILAWLDERTVALSMNRDAASRMIDAVHELRTRLIADVVTGKLDVREAAAWLSEVFDEEPSLDPLDEEATSLDGDDADAEALDPELQEA